MVIILNFEGVVEGGNSHTIKNFVSKLIDRVEGKEPGANAAGGYIVKMIGKYKGKFKVGGRKITLHQDVRDAIQFLANVVDMAPVNAKLVDVKVDELRREVTEEVARVEGTMNEKVGELREDVYEELGVLREVVAKQFTTMNVLMRANWPEWRAEGPAKALANFPAAAKGAPTSVLCLTAAAHCDSPPSEKEPLAGEPKPQQVSLPERVAPEITELAAGAAEVDSTADQSSQESSEGAATEQQEGEDYQPTFAVLSTTASTLASDVDSNSKEKEAAAALLEHLSEGQELEVNLLLEIDDPATLAATIPAPAITIGALHEKFRDVEAFWEEMKSRQETY
jgi:hypothetical protein